MSRNVRSPFANPVKRQGGNLSLFAVAAALAAWPALANSEYPPGLFENSPVVPSGPPPDAADPETPDTAAPADDYCASVAGRTFHSKDEVRRAHARCDPDRNPGPSASPDDPPAQ